MKVITVNQPHATLIALEEKGNETRSWPIKKYRGPLAIHAGKKVDREACEREPIKSTLAKHGYNADNLPTGCIVAIANLTDCKKVAEDICHAAFLSDGEVVVGNEYEFGYYEAGRFAWQLKDVKRIEPIPAKGQQGLWNYPMEGDEGGLP